MRCIGYRDIESFEPGRNSRRQSGWPSTDHQDISMHCYHLNSTSSEQKPGPIAASTL